jgi:hypothetical protein
MEVDIRSTAGLGSRGTLTTDEERALRLTFPEADIHNVDETDISTVQKPGWNLGPQ